ncbi:hypothetical protein Nstercoris_00701 [Nitrosomonas stercoris]|uniref:Uncharacterized protein n=1 Tax=Nitrosomonas stercoris TaxID=1444684 RepID=A0A4Y1YR27_9PROT|nr:hypothetical protein Nstercoris_00701 [Nitrosomonas stercoris]
METRKQYTKEFKLDAISLVLDQDHTPVLVDLFAQYRLNKHWSATFNVNNVFDKKHHQTIGTSERLNWYGPHVTFW